MKLDFLRNKWLFLDTNFLIHFSERSDFFRDIISHFQDLNVDLVIDRSVEFEFLRSANRKSELDKRHLLLKRLLGNDRVFLRFSDQLYEDAKSIAHLYSALNGQYNRQISFQDCLIAAHLKKYPGRLYLATTDIQDFPIEIFDRVDVACIDVLKTVLTIGFYSFNEMKYQKNLDDYSKS